MSGSFVITSLNRHLNRDGNLMWMCRMLEPSKPVGHVQLVFGPNPSLQVPPFWHWLSSASQNVTLGSSSEQELPVYPDTHSHLVCGPCSSWQVPPLTQKLLGISQKVSASLSSPQVDPVNPGAQLQLVAGPNSSTQVPLFSHVFLFTEHYVRVILRIVGVHCCCLHIDYIVYKHFDRSLHVGSWNPTCV